MKKKYNGEGHPNIANMLNEIALFLWRLGRHNEAIPYQEKAVSVVELRNDPYLEEYKGELEQLRANEDYPYAD